MKNKLGKAFFLLIICLVFILSGCENSLSDSPQVREQTDFTNGVQRSMLNSSVILEEWAPGIDYTVGQTVSYLQNEYVCRQAHTSIAPNWTPTNAPALWQRVYEGDNNGIVKVWIPGIQLTTGEVFLYQENNTYYESLVSHTTNSSWLPPNTPTVYRVEEVAVVVGDMVFDTALYDDLNEYYQDWKEKYLFRTGYWYVSTPHGPYTPEMQWVDTGSYAYYNGPSRWGDGSDNVDWYGSTDEGDDRRVTVSEAHGFAMLAAVQMNDRRTFGSLFTFFNRFKNADGLMKWAIALNDSYEYPGSSYYFPSDDQGNVRPEKEIGRGDLVAESEYSASDGDLDIAYALILAYQKWGSEAYKDAAQAVLNGIRNNVIHSSLNHIKLWNNCTEGVDPDSIDWDNFDYGLATRTSDAILINLLAFAEFDSSAPAGFWMNVYAQTSKVIADSADPDTGLMPDFVYFDASVGDAGAYVPIPTVTDALALGFTSEARDQPFLEHYNLDGLYYFNACRDPWRISVPSILGVSNDIVDPVIARWTTWAVAEHAVNHAPYKDGILSGYHLDGTPITIEYPGWDNYHPNDYDNWPSVLFYSPYMVMMKASGETALFNELWNTYISTRTEWNALGGFYGDQNYYAYFDDTVRLNAAISAAYVQQ